MATADVGHVLYADNVDVLIEQLNLCREYVDVMEENLVDRIIIVKVDAPDLPNRRARFARECPVDRRR